MLFGSACSSDSPDTADGGSAAAGGTGGLTGDVSCAADPRVDAYAPGLTKPGGAGVLTFELSSSQPSPPAKGQNTFEVSVRDGDGEPLTGALGIELFMPDHGHGTTVTPVVSFDESSQRFTIAPVYLFMAGVWRVELALSASDADAVPIDSAEFFFCIEG